MAIRSTNVRAFHQVSEISLRIVKILIHSNLIISLGAVGLALTTKAILSIQFDPIPLAFVFVATFIGYTINRFTDRAVDSYNVPDRAAFIERYGQVLLLVGVLGYSVALVSTYRFFPHLVPLAVLPVAVALIYSTSLIERFFILKNGLVGVIWAGIPLGLAYYSIGTISTATWLLGIIVLTYFVGAAMMFDLKDIDGDRNTGCRTLPVCYGIPTTKRVVGSILLASVPVIIVGMTAFTARFGLLLLYPLYLLPIIPCATPDHGTIFYGFIIDAEHIAIGSIAAFLILL